MANRALRAAVGAAALIGGFALPGLASADAVITNGTISLGVNNLGHLNVNRDPGSANPRGSGVGLTFNGFGDGTFPGCECEGFGVAGNGVSGFANDSSGTAGLTLESFAGVDGGATATSIVTLTGLPDLRVTQSYVPSTETPFLYVNTVMIENTGAATITDVRYTRVMDWDIPPTEFSEFVTIQGTATTTQLLFSSDDGFATANPLATRFGNIGPFGSDCASAAPTTTDFVDCGSDDHGALFDFGFGDLDPGESITFAILYGAAPNERAALAALGEESPELFSLGQSNAAGSAANDDVTFIFGFRGVGGSIIIDDPTPGDVPEPGSLALLGLGLLAGVGAVRRRRS